MKRICIFLTGALGDFLLSLPAVRKLRTRFPPAEIHMVANPVWAPLAGQVVQLDEVLSSDRIPIHAGFQECVPKGHPLYRFLASYDLIVSWFGDREDIWRRNLERACQGTVLVRSFSEHRSFDGHAADFYLEALRAIGAFEGDHVMDPFWAHSLRWDPARPACLRGEGEIPRGSSPLCLHPGSGSKAKNWPKERYLEVARRVSQRWHIPTRVLLGEAEKDQQDFWEEAEDRGLSLEIGRPLLEVAGILSRCLFYVGNDSGITHLAASLGVPTVSIFGPTDPARYAPLGPRVTILSTQRASLPHPGPPRSAHDASCRTLLGISPDEVMDALHTFLHQRFDEEIPVSR